MRTKPKAGQTQFAEGQDVVPDLFADGEDDGDFDARDVNDVIRGQFSGVRAFAGHGDDGQSQYD